MESDCFLICEFRSVELDLYLFSVKFDISGDPERNGISDPCLVGNPFGYNLFELDARVPLLICEDVLTSEEYRFGEKGGQFLDPSLDADFAVAALALCGLLNPEEGPQVGEGHARDHVHLVVEDEAEPVFSGGGQCDVGGNQQVHHLGFPPLSFCKYSIIDLAGRQLLFRYFDKSFCLFTLTLMYVSARTT